MAGVRRASRPPTPGRHRLRPARRPRSCHGAKTRRPRRRRPSRPPRRRAPRGSRPNRRGLSRRRRKSSGCRPVRRPLATASGRFIADVSKPRRAAMSLAAASSADDGCSGSTILASTKSIAPAVPVAIPAGRRPGSEGGRKVWRVPGAGSARCWPAPERRLTAVRARSRRRRRLFTPENLSVQNKRASRDCDAPLLHWSGSPSIHGALP